MFALAKLCIGGVEAREFKFEFAVAASAGDLAPELEADPYLKLV